MSDTDSPLPAHTADNVEKTSVPDRSSKPDRKPGRHPKTMFPSDTSDIEPNNRADKEWGDSSDYS